MIHPLIRSLCIVAISTVTFAAPSIAADTVHWVDDNDPAQIRLLRAINEKSLEDFISALANGADVNGKNRKSEGTPLVHAIQKDAFPFIKRLLDAGADVNLASIKGSKPIHSFAAYSKGDDRILKLLKERGANLDEPWESGGGITPLMVAYTYNKNAEDVVKSMTMLGADPNVRDYNGNSALFVATKKFPSKPEMADLLFYCNKEVDINAQNKAKQTALMLAVADGYPEMIRFLLDKGADVHLKDNKGVDALGYVNPKHGAIREIVVDALEGKYHKEKRYAYQDIFEKQNRARKISRLEADEVKAAAMPGNIDRWDFIANDWLQMKDEARAVSALDRAVTLNPGSAEALILRGRLHEKLEHRDAALADYWKAAAIEPSKYEVWMILGRVFCDKKNHKEGVPAYQRAIKEVSLRKQALLKKEAQSDKDDMEDYAGEIRGLTNLKQNLEVCVEECRP